MTDTDQREASLRRITTPNTRFDLDASEASQSADAAIAYDAGFVAGKRSQAAEIARLNGEVERMRTIWCDQHEDNGGGPCPTCADAKIARLNEQKDGWIRSGQEYAAMAQAMVAKLETEIARLNDANTALAEAVTEQAERHRAVLIVQAKLTAFYNGHSCTERDPYGVDGWKRYLCDEAKVFLASLDQASPAPGTLASLAQRAKDRGESDCLCLYAIEQTPGQPTVHDSRCKLASPRTAEGESDG